MSDSVDIGSPRWGSKTFMARYRHFFHLTDPTNCFKSSSQLEEAKSIVHLFNAKKVLPAGGLEALWKAKYLHDSAFHPETGDKQNVIGRMSFQVPGGMLITGILLAFYKSPLEIFLGQWLNQSFNALVNFTNRSGDTPLPNSVIATAYVTATSAATATAIGLNKCLPALSTNPLIARFVPFSAVAAANMVNIPLMRNRELKDGIVLTDEDGNKLGVSKKAAREAITLVTFSRICIAAPGMLFTPIIMEYLEKPGRIMHNAGKLKSCGMQTFLVGCFLLGAVPMGCALFPQRMHIKVDRLERDLAETITSSNKDIKYVYYNKGL